MKSIIAIIVLLFPFALPADDGATTWLYKLKPGLADASPLPDSTSPDGKWALFDLNAYDMGTPTTATAMVVADTNRTTLLGILDCPPPIDVDAPLKTYLTIKWSPDSKYLALHDSTPKNSVLQIYQLTATALKKLTVPDLRRLAADQLQIPEKKISGSGQVPVKWSQAGDLIVRVRLSVDGAMKQKDFTLSVSPEGVVHVAP
jgi:hypothetical protein